MCRWVSTRHKGILMTTEPEEPSTQIPDGRLLTGHVAEWGELLAVVHDRRGLTVIVADPWSGTSPLLRAALDLPALPAGQNLPAAQNYPGVPPHVYVDARR